jgi:hypothetical protein
MKHTKGPWSINHWTQAGQGVFCIGVEDGITYFSGDAAGPDIYRIVSTIKPEEHHIQGSFEGAHIAEIPDFKCQDKGSESLANAKLIAAAPELLEALEQCLSRIDPKSKDTWDLKAIYVAKQAIKKATI